ncbi:MAG: 3-dehydroquinate synthase [Alphaproteobacteria bacterium]
MSTSPKSPTVSPAVSPSVERLHVDSSAGGYSVVIGDELLHTVGKELTSCFGGTRHVVVLSDARVADLYFETLCASLEMCGHRVSHHSIPPGEEQKSFSVLESSCRAILRFGIDRESVIVTLGGGVVGDLGGLCAALLLRGLPCVQVPTTLLAQVDSSIGGKTAIDVPEGKNLVGSFHNPSLVLCSTDTLSSLPKRERAAGFAEIVKVGLGFDADFFAWLETISSQIVSGDTDTAILRRAILTSCACKARVVSMDSEERSGSRVLLNLGHSFAHGLEAVLGYDGRLLHGEAVAVGLVLATRLSERLGLLHEAMNLSHRVSSLLSQAGLVTDLRGDIFSKLSAVEILSAMRYDKKRSGGALRFVLLREVGEAFFPVHVDDEVILSVLEESLSGGAG